jgi:hypothetical protein
LLNLGITIIEEVVILVEKKVFGALIDVEYGIVKGGHTTQLIHDCQDNDCVAGGQHIEVKMITGIDGADSHT